LRAELVIDTTKRATDDRGVSLHKVIRLVFVGLVALGLAGCAQPVSEPTASPTPTPTLLTAAQRVRDVDVSSAAMGKSVKVRVVVPPDFETNPDQRWPVVYLLHGCCDDYQAWSRVSDIAALSEASGVLVVMPDGGKAGYYSDWLKGPKWETFHLTELRTYLATNFRADSTKEAIGGFSMGGFGALSYAARHPGRFKAVMALSPVADPLRDPELVLDDISSQTPKTNPYNLWGSPTKSAATWKKHDPYYLASGLRDATVYLYAGTGKDAWEPSLRAETVKLADRLKSLGLAKLDITLTQRTNQPGTHLARYWNRELKNAWPSLIAAVKA
jgi:diacylglycerol O-acyltransferase / trehalose O-mycolyltransferase